MPRTRACAMQVFSVAELQALADIVRRNPQLTVIADEVRGVLACEGMRSSVVHTGTGVQRCGRGEVASSVHQ
jgi:hypothetical protein